jgi:hypothetical protein
MLFRILRAFLRDEEYYRLNMQLTHAVSFLSEYQKALTSTSGAQVNTFKDMLEDDRLAKAKEERGKVDAGFIALVWASVAAAIAFGGYAAKHVPRISINSNLDFTGGIWLVLSLVALLFTAANGIFAISLTRRYAMSKDDKGYKFYAESLWVSIIIGVACAMILYLRDSL